MQKRTYLFVIAIILIITSFSFAQMSTIRNQIFVGARPMGMGESYVAVADDGNAIYWNPAGLPLLDRFEFYSMHSNLFNIGIKNNYLSFILPYSEKIAYGIDWFNLSYGDNELKYSQNMFNFSVGILPIQVLSLGLNVKYFTRDASLDGYSGGAGSGWGADLGVMILPGKFIPMLKGLKLGIMAHDFTNTKIKYKTGISDVFQLRNIRYGLSYTFDNLFFFEHPLIAIDFDNRIHLGLELWLPDFYNLQLGFRTGLQKDIYKYGEKKLTSSFGASIRYKIKDSYDLNFDYSYTNSPILTSTNRFSLGISFALPPSPVTVDTVFIRDIYASLYPYHADTSYGMLKCKYHDNKKLDVRIKAQQPQYGISSETKVILNPEMQPEDTLKTIELTPYFSHKILEARGENKVRADIKIEPKMLIRTRPERIISNDFTIYGLGKINWQQGEDQFAAFVTGDDPIIRQFAITTVNLYQDSPVIICDNITYVAQIFNSLRECNISYIGDEYSSFGNKKYIDTIKYPRQLLNEKKGDCDDLTALFCSMLESIGIQTKFVCTPDHIFLIFNTELPGKLEAKFCVNEDMYLIINQYVWLPVETTLIGEKDKLFWDAWKIAAEQLKLESNIIDVYKAQEKYRPISNNYLDRIQNPKKISVPLSLSTEALGKHHHSIQDNRKKYLTELKNKVAQHPKDLQLRLKLANIYVMLDSIDQAELNYKVALSIESNNFVAYNNLGNLYFITEKWNEAKKNYQNAMICAKTAIDSNSVYLNFGTLYFATDSLELALQMYGKVIKGSEDIESVEQLLGISLSEIDLSRAAKSSKRISINQIKRLIQDTLNRAGIKQKHKYKKSSRKITRSKEEIEDVFYWAK